jgi:hypothetical protein
MNKYYFSLKISFLTAIILSQLNHSAAFAGTLVLNREVEIASFSIIPNSTEKTQIYNDDLLVNSTGLEQLARDIWLSDLGKNVNVYNQDLIKTSVKSPINFKSANHLSEERKLFDSLASTLKETKKAGDRQSLSTSKILSILTQVNDSNAEQNIYDLLNNYSGKSEQEAKDNNFHSFKDVVTDLFKKDSTIRSILNDPNSYLSNVDLNSISNDNFDLKSAIAKYKSTQRNDSNNKLTTVSVTATIPKYSHSPLNSVNRKQQKQLIPSLGTQIKTTYQPATYQAIKLNSLPKNQEQEKLEKQLEQVRVQIDKQRQKREQKKQQEEQILKQRKGKQLAELQKRQEQRQQQIKDSLAN